MERPLDNLDWSLVGVFLAVAEAGSLSAAARTLGSSQPTVGRQIKEIEERLGTALFRRQASGMALTAAGSALVAPAREMRDAAGRFAVAAAGAEAELAGSVRITASVATAHHVLPPIVAAIREAEPDIAIDLTATDATENLLFREADIAVRMFRPRQLDMVTRHIGDAPLGLFGARRYLDRVGRPASPDALRNYDFVGYDRATDIVDGFRASGWDVDREFFRTRCDQNTVYWELVRAGCGLGFGQARVGRRDPTVEEVDLGLPIPPLPVWLTAHPALRHTPRIRRVWDLLADALRDFLS